MYQITGRYECIGKHDGKIEGIARRLFKRKANRKDRHRIKRMIYLAIKRNAS